MFELKEKCNLDFVDEALQDAVSDNYKSAEESAEDIERQVMEEVERGSILMMDEELVKKEFAGRLATLGAVPKELGSSVVRVTHDGSFSVDVNRRIRVRDRMRFPMIDDASAILMQLEEEVEKSRGLVRFSLIYDVSRAHKLIPVCKRDWGLQAFRLPGGGPLVRCSFTQEGHLGLPVRRTGGRGWQQWLRGQPTGLRGESLALFICFSQMMDG